MLTTTQREWAEAQVGRKRELPFSGVVTAVAPTQHSGFHDLTVSADNGSVVYRARMSSELAAKHKGEKMSSRFQGTVERVEYDDPNRRVGLVVTAPSGSLIEWVVPELSDDEKVARQAELDQADAYRREAEAMDFKRRVLDLINNDADVRAALKLAVQ